MKHSPSLQVTGNLGGKDKAFHLFYKFKLFIVSALTSKGLINDVGGTLVFE